MWLDVLQWRRGALFFIVIGMNAITIYFAQRFINFREISQFFLAGIVSLSGSYGRLVTLFGILVAEWLFLWMLYRQKLFLRV